MDKVESAENRGLADPYRHLSVPQRFSEVRDHRYFALSGHIPLQLTQERADDAGVDAGFLREDSGFHQIKTVEASDLLRGGSGGRLDKELLGLVADLFARKLPVKCFGVFRGGTIMHVGCRPVAQRLGITP